MGGCLGLLWSFYGDYNGTMGQLLGLKSGSAGINSLSPAHLATGSVHVAPPVGGIWVGTIMYHYPGVQVELKLKLLLH